MPATAPRTDVIDSRHQQRLQAVRAAVAARGQAGRSQLLLRSLLRLVCLTWFRYSVHGQVPTGPLILAPNHTGLLDPLPLERMAPWRRPRPVVMAKAPLFTLPVLWRVCAGLGFFPVQRGSGDQQAVDTAVQVLRAGGRLGLLPEGTWVPGTEIGQFRSGAARIALQADVPILPIYVHGAHESRKAWLPKRLRFQVLIGEPLWADPDADDPVAELTARARQQMLALQQRILTGG